MKALESVLNPNEQFVFVAVSNLALVKPDKAKAVENYLIQMARFGQLAGKVSIFSNSFLHI